MTLVSDGTAGDAVMSYVDTASAGNWAFATTAAQTGTVTLPWSYSGDHGGFAVSTAVGAVINEVIVDPLVNEPTSGPFSYNGTFTFNVNAGDTYGSVFGGDFLEFVPVSGTFTVDVSHDPTTKDECKDGGWAAFGFSNQGQCITFVETGHDSR